MFIDTILHLLFCVNFVTSVRPNKYSQNDYEVVSERFEFFMDDKFVKDLKYRNFKYNRTFHALNISATFKIDFNRNARFLVQAYEFASNEYRFFPMTFDGNLCTILETKLFGLEKIYDCGNLFRCPVKKGHYTLCSFQPDYRKFPPYIPSGRYRLDINISHLSENVGLMQWYETTKRKFD